MPKVTVELASLLRNIVNGEPSVAIEAETLRGALEGIIERYPALEVHLFDESRDLRQHVLVLHNGANSRWKDSLDVAIADGDTVTLMQAVSGG